MTSLATILLAATAAMYPASGPAPGQYVVAFEPHHVTGPFADTQTCPVCEFPLNPGVLVWVNGESDETVVSIASALERKMRAVNADRHGTEKLVSFVVFLEDPGAATARLAAISARARLTQVALTVLPPDSRAVTNYGIRITPFVRTTTLVYRETEVSANLRNLGPEDTRLLETAIDAVLAE